MESHLYDVAIVGGGASGYFAAANLSIVNRGLRCCLFEGGSKTLNKVLISGGGRCNLTHHEFDIAQLVEHYPRGHRELRGSFSRFQPRDTIEWFLQRGVQTKVEQDGRMFPKSDDSRDVIRCLREASEHAGVELQLNARLSDLRYDGVGKRFTLEFKNGDRCEAKVVVLATGSHPSGHRVAEKLGHSIVTPTPSLFTFNIDDSRLLDLSGLSFENVQLALRYGKKKFLQQGPMLITHWGLSGPAILRLSAWASKELAEMNYKGELTIDFAPDSKLFQVSDILEKFRTAMGSKNIENVVVPFFPKRYWQRLLETLDLVGCKVSQIPRKKSEQLLAEVKQAAFSFDGKSTHKNEFVTAGGVSTAEIDMKTQQSRHVPGLYFVGEILNIDGVTGGFNFQHAWTSAYLCAEHLNECFEFE